jgi:hypothetical protein
LYSLEIPSSATDLKDFARWVVGVDQKFGSACGKLFAVRGKFASLLMQSS